LAACIHTHQDVKKANRPVKSALSGQYALMVINIIVNLIVGLIFPILMIINAVSITATQGLQSLDYDETLRPTLCTLSFRTNH
jgi:hypothetical protein